MKLEKLEMFDCLKDKKKDHYHQLRLWMMAVYD